MEQSFTHHLLSPGTSGSLPVPAGTIGTIAHSIMSEVFYHCATWVENSGESNPD